MLINTGLGNKESKLYKSFIYRYEFEIPDNIFQTKKFCDIIIENY